MALRRATAHALAFLDGLPERHVAPVLDVADVRRRFDIPLPMQGADPATVIDELVAAAEGAIMASTGGRFFGWVIGGNLPAALAADWLAAAWDQNAAAYACSPAAAAVEEVCGRWLKELLGLPMEASFAFVSGCQMAHTTALAAARHRLLATRGIDVARAGIHGAPPIRLLTTENRHESILRSLRLLGIGTDAMELVAGDDAGAIRLDALAAALNRGGDRPTIVCVQAGDLNTGAFDPFEPACAMARSAGAWVHVDGAFGLWAATSAHHRDLLTGVEHADSWATDGHKWLNLPFDNGFVFVADPDAHRAVFSQPTSYTVVVNDAREPKDWTPEWSRRARGFAVYAAIRSLGQTGIGEMVARCCDLAVRLADGLGALPGVEVLARPRINQGLVRFLAADGDHDRRTDRVIAAIQASGVAWFGGTTWRGKRAMRISVCNWRTSAADVDRTLTAVREIAERVNDPA